MDRAVYEIAALRDGREPSPARDEASWNSRLVYTFGGGCNVGYHQAPAIPQAHLYHPVTNPGGIKCTTAEQLVTQVGRDPQTGFARGYDDNVGVRYGLEALRAGRYRRAGHHAGSSTCAYSRPGVGFRGLAGVWQSY